MSIIIIIYFQLIYDKYQSIIIIIIIFIITDR